MDHKDVQMQIFRGYLEHCKKKNGGSLCRSVTTDGTWIHYCTPKTKEQVKQWKNGGLLFIKEDKISTICRKTDGLNIQGSKRYIVERLSSKRYYSNTLGND